jgi:hypothetical protein
VTALFALVVTLAAVAVAATMVVLIRRHVPLDVLHGHHEVGGILFNALGIIYGILIAFLVFVVWTNYQSLKLSVATEADQLIDLARLSAGFPPQTRASIHLALRNYTDLVMDEEWAAMRDGHESPRVEKAIENLWTLYVNAQPQMVNNPLYAESLDRLAILADARRGRLNQAAEGLHSILWIFLIGGGVIMIAFTHFFGMKSVPAQLFMTGAVAAEITFLLYLIAAIDRPFDGAMQVDTAPMRRVIQRLNSTPP